MDSNRVIAGVVKLLVLLVALGALYFLWNEQFPRTPPNTVASDETPLAKTDVAVQVDVIRRGTLHAYVTAYGSVQPAPASTTQPAASANISVPSTALVATVNCTEGQHVEAGKTLFALDSRSVDSEIERDQKILNAAQAQTTSSPPDWYLSSVQLVRDFAQAQLIDAQARKNLLTFNAPISGTVVSLHISPGEVADPTVPSVQIVNLGNLIAELHVPSSEIMRVKPNQSARIRFPANQALSATTQPTELDATVRLVDANVDSTSDVGFVDLSMPTNSGLRPGQFVSASISIEDHKDCLIVPAAAVVRDSLDRAFIGVVSDDHKHAVLQLVQTVLRDGDNVEVRGDNIAEGQTIVTTGSAALLSKTGIRIFGQTPAQ